MSTESLRKFADELKNTREKNNLTIEQIFSKTRIDKKYLLAIEEGNFSILPEVYIRAFVKEYAKAIQLDPTEVLEKFERAQKGLVDEDTSEKVSQSESAKSDEEISKEEVKSKISEAVELDSRSEIHDKSSKSNKTLYYALSGILMLVFIFVIYKVFLTERNTEIITEKPFEEIIEAQTDEADEIKSDLDVSGVNPRGMEQVKPTEGKEGSQDRAQGNLVQPLKEGVLTLTILGEAKSWIRVVSDQKDNMEFTIEKGINKVITAKQRFYLHIGNSGGVKLLLNNKELRFSGTPGKVRKIFVTKDGIQYLRRTPRLNAAEG